MLTWFIIHMAALVGDLAVFLVLLHTVGLSPPSLLLVSVTGAWTPGMGAHGLGAGISSHGSATWFRGWLAGFQRKPLDIPSTQPLL